jgi:hypothetical protein
MTNRVEPKTNERREQEQEQNEQGQRRKTRINTTPPLPMLVMTNACIAIAYTRGRGEQQQQQNTYFDILLLYVTHKICAIGLFLSEMVRLFGIISKKSFAEIIPEKNCPLLIKAKPFLCLNIFSEIPEINRHSKFLFLFFGLGEIFEKKNLS